MLETWITAIVITWAIKHFVEKGKQEYAHIRDTHADTIAREHPDWSQRKKMRHARRRARGYWWDQINRGFPDLKDAYEEDRLIAEYARVQAARDGVKRRKELRDRIDEVMGERQRILDEIKAEEEARQAPQTDKPESMPKDAAKAEAAPETRPVPAPEPATQPQDTDPEAATDPKVDPKEASEPQGKPAPEEQDAEQDHARQPDQPSGKPADDVIVPFRRPSTTAETNGEEVPMSTPYTGQTATAGISEAHGYEQILGAHNDEVERRTHLAERAANELAEAEEADAGYELHIGMLRSHKADDASIEDVVHLREANEQGIAAARDRHSAALSALAAAVAARDNWVGRHGAVYEAKVNTNTSGDEALYTP